MENTSMVDVQYLRTDQLRPNDYNPNRMAKEEFRELVEEVRHLARLPKPVVVRLGEAEDGYVIVDGEHGWRAAKEVGLDEVPCEVIESDNFEAMRQTYKRNQHGIHERASLGHMFQRMMDERELSARALGKEINVSEGTIRNALLFARADQLRNGCAHTHGARGHWFSRMTVRQVRLYVEMPDIIRDRWVDSGYPDEWGFPEGQGFGDVGNLLSYLHRLGRSGLSKVFERGTWGDNVRVAYELYMWRDKHHRLLGDVVDDYIRPVVELHPKNPTPVMLLNTLPIVCDKPFLTPEEWADALRVAWEKSDKVYDVLGRIKDVAKLKAGKSEDVPTEDLEDPRVALMKLEVEQDAPDFVRNAEIPLRDKRFLTYDARADHLSEEDVLRFKRETVKILTDLHRKYREQHAAYDKHLEQIDQGQLMQMMLSGRGPRRPSFPLPANKVWERYVEERRRQEQEKARVEAERAILGDPNKLVGRVVGKLREAAPRTFEKQLGDQKAWQVLEERLRALPKPELALLTALLLKTSVGSWLEAVKSEEEDGNEE